MAKLYCILAREADTGVIFRRGPSKQVRLIGWDLNNNKFEPGHWFNGRIYSEKSDLSPDGTKLVYFAANYQRRVMPTWTAVSTPPFLTAHLLWRAIGTTGDLSLFETNTALALSTYRDDSSIEPEAGFSLPSRLRVKHKPYPGYFHVLADHDRLIRDGWSVTAGDPVYHSKSPEQGKPVIYRKPVAGGARSIYLEMTARSDHKRVFTLTDGSGNTFDLKADWAEVRGDNVLYSQGGKLLSMAARTSGKHIGTDPVRELADFDDMTFQSFEAPEWAKTW
jgi:hypothetical protein